MFLISARQLTTATRTFSSRQLTSAAASSSEKLTENFSIEVTQDGIAMITLDMPGAPVNTLQSSLSAEFPTVLSRIESDSTIKAAVLRSGKPGVWVAGADINELAACNTAADAQKLSADGQAGLATIEACSKPIVAAINGACLGGGLELAMACHYRVASTDSKCKLGLPEVQLGLLPGAGGTQRLQKLIGIQEALKMTTMGRQDKADKAKRTGLVDVVADPNALDHAAHLCALQLADGTLKRSKGKKKNMMGRALEDNPVGRKVLFQQARKAADKASGGNYPAIPLIIDCIEKGAESGMSAGLKLEAENFGKLTQTNESAALIGLFHGTTATKKNPYGKPKSPAKTVGVLGAGLMGAGIGQVSATRGHKVLLKDINASAVARGLKQVEDSLNTRVKRRRMSVFDRDNIVAKITGLDNDGNWKDHFAKCDLVIEAVLEEMHIKHAVVKEFEAVLPKHAVIASNTSGLKVKDIASVSARPENIVGMHYFSPVDKMQLLEVVRTDQTSDEAAAIAVDAGLKQGKFVIVTKDVSGFYVNRCIGKFSVHFSSFFFFFFFFFF
jgi:enoyl-CoA hydratase/long-chain 3-hydroxyacyl-CoA dehydrogenase